MASGKEYRDFILEQLSDLDDVSYRAMMGEYILYYRGKNIKDIIELANEKSLSAIRVPEDGEYIAL